MGGEPWSDAESARLAEVFPDTLTGDIPQILHDEFGTNRTTASCAKRASKMGLRKSDGFDKFSKFRSYTREENDFLIGYIPGHTQDEVIEEFGRRFGRELTLQQLKGRVNWLKVRHGVNSGRFKKGQAAHNKGMSWDEQGIPEDVQARMRDAGFKKGARSPRTSELLSERVTTDGYVYVKVDPRNAKNRMAYWIGKGRFVWMQANGRDWPDGHRCLFIDGDKRNFDPENLMAVPDELYPMITGAVDRQVYWFDRDTLEVALTSARITHEISRIRRERNDENGRD